MDTAALRYEASWGSPPSTMVIPLVTTQPECFELAMDDLLGGAEEPLECHATHM